MPRRPSTPAAELPGQTQTDAQPDDESWRDQSIPEFPDIPKTHEQRLSDLDARDDRLNGHTPQSEDEFDPDHLYHDPGQPELPGTPAPAVTTDAYSIPFEGQFNGQDFQAAPGIEEIAERHIQTTQEFEHLIGIKIRYFWKRRGGLKGGNPRLAALVKPGGLSAYALGRPQFALWLAADHCRDAKLTNEQIDALVFDMLCRAHQDPDDHDQYRITGPDFEGNILTLQRFGFWHPDLRELGGNIKQLGLLDGVELAGAGDDDQDDDEDGE